LAVFKLTVLIYVVYFAPNVANTEQTTVKTYIYAQATDNKT